MNLETLKELFMLMTVIHLGLFIWITVACLAAKGFIQRIHGKLFGLSHETINTMLYGFLGAYKIALFIFVLVPWIALTIMC